MNRHEPIFRRAGRRSFAISDADFQVLTEGDHVRCAVTGAPIRLEELRYWNVARQEAYASAGAAFQRHLETMAK